MLQLQAGLKLEQKYAPQFRQEREQVKTSPVRIRGSPSLEPKPPGQQAGVAQKYYCFPPAF